METFKFKVGMELTQEVRNALPPEIGASGSGEYRGAPSDAGPSGSQHFTATVKADSQEAAQAKLREALQPWGDVPIVPA